MILAKDPPLKKVCSLQESRQPSPHKINTLTEGLERLLKRAATLHAESDSTRVRRHPFARSPQTLLAKSSSKIREKARRIAVGSSTHPPKLARDSPEKHSLQGSTSRELRIDEFVLGKKLGSGKFSDVYLAMHKQTRTIYAVKTILKSVIAEYRMEAQLQQEYEVQARLDHPNIIKCYAKFEDQFHYFLLMEYFHGEELLKRVKAPEKEVAGIVRQVIDAVMYLHRNGFAHRDLKPENILIDGEGQVKITDFGWAGNCSNSMRSTFCGTYDYVSPEVLAKKLHNIEVDIWAIGVLTYELLSGEVPFKDIKNQQAIQLERITFPKEISEKASRFISLFLVKDPLARVNLHIALNHPFLHF